MMLDFLKDEIWLVTFFGAHNGSIRALCECTHGQRRIRNDIIMTGYKREELAKRAWKRFAKKHGITNWEFV